MTKKIFAAFLVITFVLGIVLTAMPAMAHTTLGRPIPTDPYAVRDADTSGIGHVFGATGYVWPGGGKDWYTGVLSEPPGYQNPWGVYPSMAPLTWWQLRGNTYAPFGAILTSMEDKDNMGDLIFAINFTWASYVGEAQATDPSDVKTDYNALVGYTATQIAYTDVIIYVPPEFGNVDAGSISTTISQPFGGNVISVHTADVKDPFGPGFTIIRVPGSVAFTYANDFAEWYYIRVNNVVAPEIAGRYNFKIFLNNTFPMMNVVNNAGVTTDKDGDGSLSMIDYVTSTMPAENWPSILAKGEIDPGIVEGGVVFGGWDTALYNEPMALPGRVRLVGEATDPYTGELTGRTVEARGYFNASAEGKYTVEGVAPGIYDVYASAAGYPEVLQATGIEVLPGKSVNLGLGLNPGAIIWGNIFAKHSYGDVVWGREVPVMVEIYDSNDWPEPFPGAVWGDVDGTAPDNYLDWEADHLKAFSPINLTDSPYTSYVNGPQVIFDPDLGYVQLNDGAVTTTGSYATAVTPRSVAFPWTGLGLSGTATTAYGGKDPSGIYNGVGPAQTWWTSPTMNTFNFRFGNKIRNDADGTRYGLYGTPTEFDGHIPQVFASWINGLTAGTYYIRAWINGFVQTDASGTYMDYTVNIAEQEWAGDIYVPIDVQLTGWVNKTVHFRYGAGSLEETTAAAGDGGDAPIDNWRFLIVEARDSAGTLVAFNFTQVESTATRANIYLNGFGMAGPVLFNDWDSLAGAWRWDANLMVDPVGMKFFLYRYRHIRDYGLMPGTYKIYAYMRGFVEQEFEMASVSLSGQPTWISDHLYVGAGINMTVYSIDWQHPRITRNWQYPGEYILINVFNEDDVGMGTVNYFHRTSGTGTTGVGYWDAPTQQSGVNTVPARGWPADSSKLKFHGSVNLEKTGPDNIVGVYTPDSTWGLTDSGASLWYTTVNPAWAWLLLPSLYRDDDFNTVVGLETGQYHFTLTTYGYVFKDADKYTLWIAKGAQGDTKLNVVIGVNFTINIIFKKEGIIEHIPYDMVFGLTIYDEDGNSVASPYTKTNEQGTAVNTGPAYSILRCNEQIIIQTAGHSDKDAASSGVDGYANYVGDWTVEIVTYYVIRDSVANLWYPPPPGLLLGATDGRWGPYEMRTEVIIPNAPLSGEASIIFEVDQRGFLQGQIAGFTWSDELRTVSFANIMVSGAEGEQTMYSYDGRYELFLPRGEYDMTIEMFSGDQGFYSQTVSVVAPDGGSATFNFLNMERSGIAIPEFPTAVIAILSALGASLYVLRKANRK